MIHANEKLYACNLCNKKFLSNARLKLHEGVHTGNTSYKCAFCSKSFENSCSLRRHKARMHEKIKSNKFLHCSKSYFSKQELSIQTKTHTGNQSHRCAECGKTFQTSSALVLHKCIHINPKSDGSCKQFNFKSINKTLEYIEMSKHTRVICEDKKQHHYLIKTKFNVKCHNFSQNGQGGDQCGERKMTASLYTQKQTDRKFEFHFSLSRSKKKIYSMSNLNTFHSTAILSSTAKRSVESSSDPESGESEIDVMDSDHESLITDSNNTVEGLNLSNENKTVIAKFSVRFIYYGTLEGQKKSLQKQKKASGTNYGIAVGPHLKNEKWNADSRFDAYMNAPLQFLDLNDIERLLLT